MSNHLFTQVTIIWIALIFLFFGDLTNFMEDYTSII